MGPALSLARAAWEKAVTGKQHCPAVEPVTEFESHAAVGSHVALTAARANVEGESYRAGGMPAQAQHAQPQLADPDRVAVTDPDVRGQGMWSASALPAAVFGTRSRNDVSQGPVVVPVSMRRDDRLQLTIARASHQPGNPRRLVGGVNQRLSARPHAGHQVHVVIHR